MGCTDSSFEINKSNDNLFNEMEDDLFPIDNKEKRKTNNNKNNQNNEINNDYSNNINNNSLNKENNEIIKIENCNNIDYKDEDNNNYNNENNNIINFENNNDNKLESKTSTTKSLNKKKLKKSTTKIKKEPFILKTINNGYSCINIIKINASLFLKEYLIPIWFEKNTYIKFKSEGKWRIDKKYNYTDSAGMPTSNTLNFNYGAAVAHIGIGPQFLIPPNESTYFTKNEGPLYLKINLPKKMKVAPDGTMEISIYDGIYMPVEEIYKKMGWYENNKNYNIKAPTELENNLVNTFNDLRMNPILFYEINIKENQNIIWTEDYLKKKFNSKLNKNYNNKKNEIQPFYINDDCYIILNRELENYFDTEKKFNKQKENIYLEELSNYLSSNIKNELMLDNYIICKLTRKNKPIDICIQYLLDKKFRSFIFDNEYNSITVKLIQNFYEESSLVILAILKIEKNENKKNDQNEEKNI